MLFGQAVFGIVITDVWGAAQWTTAALGYGVCFLEDKIKERRTLMVIRIDADQSIHDAAPFCCRDFTNKNQPTSWYHMSVELWNVVLDSNKLSNECPFINDQVVGLFNEIAFPLREKK